MKEQLLSELLLAVSQTQLTEQKKEQYLEIPHIVNELAGEIISHTYQPYSYTCFAICDPTPREILAPHFRDRIVHRWLVNKMESYIDKRFLDCSYANRKGKGHHRAVKQLQRYLQNSANKYYLKMDIESFFNSIDHAVLLNFVKRWIVKLPCAEDEKEILFSVCQTIITHNPTKNVVYTGNKENLKLIPKSKSYFNNKKGVGLPLGNLSSQFFANLYLHELDFFVKHKLPSPFGEGQGVRHYLRYVDDFVLLSNSAQELKQWRTSITQFLSEALSLKVHPKKIMLQPVTHGIDFLGYFVKPKYMLVRRRAVKNIKRKIMEWENSNKAEHLEEKEVKSIQASINSYYGIFRNADAYNLGKELYLKRFSKMKKYFYLHIQAGKQKVKIRTIKNLIDEKFVSSSRT